MRKDRSSMARQMPRECMRSASRMSEDLSNAGEQGSQIGNLLTRVAEGSTPAKSFASCGPAGTGRLRPAQHAPDLLATHGRAMAV